MKKAVIICTVFVIVLSICAPISALTSSEISKTLADPYMILVNRTNKVSSNYVPKNLVQYPGSDYKLEKTCAAALQKMISGCTAAGNKTLYLYSGYRTYTTQYNKYYNKINYYMGQGYSKAKATALTDQYYAPPGGSEHHTGLAADICTASIVNQYGQLHESFGKTAEGKWLRNNCYKYGFILRYDEGKENITGYNYEPWHFRYVGLAVAKEIFDQKITFEEYIQNLKTAKEILKSAPKFTVNGSKISLSAPSDTTIRYTNNGTTPTLSSSKYTTPLQGKNITFKAIACYNGHTSPVRTLTVTKYGEIFTDITTKDWYYNTVSEAVHKDLFHGVDTYSFAPNDTMTRAMFVQVFANLSGVDLKKYRGKSKFTDVKSSAWYAPAIVWASENGIVSGIGDDRFAPNDAVTREQACVIIHNYSKDRKEYPILTFKDTVKVSKWALSAVRYCCAGKIVSGYPDRTFKPQNTATRAETAQIFLNYLRAK